jgi:DNA-binding CsgD family transcriptional regulator
MSSSRKNPGSHGHEAGQSSLVHFQDVLDRVALSAWLTDASFTILFANAALIQATQLRPQDILGKPSEILLLQNPGDFLPANPRGWSGPVTCREMFRRNFPTMLTVLPLATGPASTAHRSDVAPSALFVLGEAEAAPSVERVLLAAFLPALLHPPAHPGVVRLTPRQKTIHRLLLRAYTYKEIASELGLAHATVRVLVTQVRRRLGPQSVPILRQNVTKPR